MAKMTKAEWKAERARLAAMPPHDYAADVRRIRAHIEAVSERHAAATAARPRPALYIVR